MSPARLRLAALALSLAACKDDKPGGAPDDTTADPNEPAPELPLPDLSGIDLGAAYQESLAAVLSVHAGVAFDGHAQALARSHAGCPDVWLGAPADLVDADQVDEDARGLSWSDTCETPGGLFFRGTMYWESDARASGDATTSAGRSEQGSRTLIGAGAIGDATETQFQMRGEVSDAMSRVIAPDYERWTWSSTVNASVSGTDAMDPIASPTPGGWRAGLYLAATGGDADRIEARGDLYLFEHRIAGRFDSVAVQLALPGENAAGPTDCTLEPRGWIGLRDENAWWIDVVFLPTGEDDATAEHPEDEYTACDGCGKVYVRGLEEEAIGEVCPDFSVFFAEGAVPQIPVTDYIQSGHGGSNPRQP
jgi:hypothetical protein